MNVVGLITEYNPFHNGHRLHLQRAVALTGAEAVVAVMSGNFLQRGEPALFNRWARTEMALAIGVDAVLELPAAFATRSARQFAAGAVKTLHATGVVTHLCFGSEQGEIDPLRRLANIFLHEPPELKSLIKKHLRSGVTLPAAETRALDEYVLAADTKLQASDLTMLNKPNNILGIEYLRTLVELASPIEPITIARVAAGYHDEHFSDEGIASAKGIRKNLEQTSGKLDNVSEVVPDDTLRIMNEEVSSGRGPVYPEQLLPLLLYRLRTISEDQLTGLLDIGEGLENRILKASRSAQSLTELIKAVKTKRYTWTRIQRALLYILLGYTREMAQIFDETGPGYLRILGVSAKGRELVRRMKKKSELPVITRVAPFFKTPGPAREMLKLDALATDIYTLLYPQSGHQQAGLDFNVMPLMLK